VGRCGGDAEDDARTIGARARMIRRRRGLSLDVVAGLAGISPAYLSMLERGQRGFNRRGLLEDLADAVGCSVIDLTGQPYLPPDPASADALSTLPAVNIAFHECGLFDAPDVPTRPVEQLAALVAAVNPHVDETRYQLAGQGFRRSTHRVVRACDIRNT
jgi:transcriptional regulator with XRE-family HTH domain